MNENKSYFKINWKTLLTLIVVLILYFLPIIIFRPNHMYYIALTGAQIPFWVYQFFWILATIALAMFVTIYIQKYRCCDSVDEKYGYKRLFLYIILNYLFGFAFIPTFFVANNLFLSYVLAIALFITTIFVVMEVYMIKKCDSFWLLPYALWSAFLSVMTVILYLQN